MKNRCPYPGLRPFAQEDAPFFFGRDAVVDEVFYRLETSRALVLVGPSGSGKSSLVRAGVLPVVTTGGWQCRAVVMRPSNRPVHNLASALQDAGIPAKEPDLRASSFGIVNCVAAAGAAQERVLVVVDQFEELFRFREEGELSNEIDFFATLLASTITSDTHIYVLITLRADFLGELAQLPALPDAVSRSLLLLPRMTRSQLAQVIERPLEEVSKSIAPFCVQRLLNDAEPTMDSLPRLQHVLMQMWQRRDDRVNQLGMADYESAGTISRSIDVHAESVFAGLPNAWRDLARRMFQLLVAEENGIIFRRPAQLREVAAVAGCPDEEAYQCARYFEMNGLLMISGSGEAPTFFDLANHTISRVWERLTRWISEETQARNIYLRLIESVKLREEGLSSLLQDPELSVALKWVNSWKPNEAWAARHSAPEDFKQVISYLEESKRGSGTLWSSLTLRLRGLFR